MKKLYIEQKIFKITDHYPILDESENIVYYVDQEFRWFLSKYEISTPDRRKIVDIEQRFRWFLPSYDIDFASGESFTFNTKFTFVRPRFEIDTPFGHISVEGNFIQTNYEVHLDNHLIGEVRKAFWAMRDRFEITVVDEDFQDLLVAVMIIVDNVQDNQSN